MRASTWRQSRTCSGRFPGLELIFIESGGDNLAATFSPELADLTIYVIDVSAGDKIPRKGGPGITRSDLLVINKIDLAPLVEASLEVMDRDSRRMRGTRPFIFTNLKKDLGVREIAQFIIGAARWALTADATVNNPTGSMIPRQRIVRERRQYNQWVNSQTLEDYALRYTAGARAQVRRSASATPRSGRSRSSPARPSAAPLTLTYGFANAVWAIAAFAVLMFLIGLPIAHYAARYGVDIDLLTRGAGFGYMGSTITSLIYASFTFLLFSIEASIMSVALHMLFGHAAWRWRTSSARWSSFRSRSTASASSAACSWRPRAIWLVLQFLPLVYVVDPRTCRIAAWTHYSGAQGNPNGSLESAAVRHGRLDAAVAAAADRRAGGLPALPAGAQGRQQPRLVDSRCC